MMSILKMVLLGVPKIRKALRFLRGAKKAGKENKKLKLFIKRFIGQRVLGGQCVGLYRQYIKDVLKLPALEGLGSTGGASGLFTRYDTDVGPLSRRYLERIAFDGNNRPEPGDVVIYGPTETNRWGHVGIYVEPSNAPGEMIIFDQHGFGSQEDAGAQLRPRSNIGLLGWLRKRQRRL